MTLRVVHVAAEGQDPTGPWELINGFLFPPGTYRSLWAGKRPGTFSVVRLKCMLDESPPFPWARHPEGSWSRACPHRRRAGMTVVPMPPCRFCMIDAGVDGLLAELAAGRPPSSMDVRMIEVQASEVEAKNVVAGGQGVCRIQPSEPKPHPKDPTWLVPQWEPPEIEELPPTEVMKRPTLDPTSRD